MRVPGADAVIHVIGRHGSTWRDRQAAISPTSEMFAILVPVTGISRCRLAGREMPAEKAAADRSESHSRGANCTSRMRFGRSRGA